MPGLRQKTRTGAHRRRPRFLEAARLHRARHIQLPFLLGTGTIAQTLERNFDFNFVAVVGQMPLRFPDVVGCQVGGFTRFGRIREEGATGGVAARLNQHTIALNADRIDAKHQCLPTVIVGAEEELNVVVLRDLVAISECVAHRSRRSVRADADVQRGRRIEDKDFGAVARGNAIGRIELREASEQCRFAPHRFVEHSVHDRAGRFSRRRDGECATSSVVHRAGMRIARRR